MEFEFETPKKISMC